MTSICDLYSLVNLFKCEFCNRICLKANQLVQLNFENSSYSAAIMCPV